MGGHAEARGPDFSHGIAVAKIPLNGTLSGRVGEEAVLVSRFADGFFAVSGACTHYGAVLSDGLCDSGTARCPWHHACFSLRTGAALRAPALDDLDTWRVEVEGETLFVRNKQTAEIPVKVLPDSDVRRIVIVGGGAAGLACANELRRIGYQGAVTMLSADCDPPVDRPNLSKDYLAGTAPAEWMPLRSDDWYRDKDIDLRLGVEVVRIDPDIGRVHTTGGDTFVYDRLLLATGSEPNRLTASGFDLENVFTLRSFADARAIAGQVKPGIRAAIIGSSFIGLEAASALQKRGVEVHVISPEKVPFQGVFGEEVGRFFQAVHERNGVNFHLCTTAGSFDGSSLSLANGTRLPADIVLVGIGVKPRTRVAESAGIAALGGVPVDAFLETGIPNIYAAGDIASYPDPRTGEPQRIEHWVVAERQGQVAAANMLGLRRRYDDVPFFWTEQFGVSLRYVGHAGNWDRVAVDGDVESGDFIVRYFEQGEHRASAGVGRDFEILADEQVMESRLADSHVEADLREPQASGAIKYAT